MSTLSVTDDTFAQGRKEKDGWYSKVYVESDVADGPAPISFENKDEIVQDWTLMFEVNKTSRRRSLDTGWGNRLI